MGLANLIACGQVAMDWAAATSALWAAAPDSFDMVASGADGFGVFSADEPTTCAHEIKARCRQGRG